MGKVPDEPKSAVIQHFSHSHPLNLKNCSTSDGSLVPSSCFCCNKRVNGWGYSCDPCNFLLHRDCSSLPQHMKHSFDANHTLSLLCNDKTSFSCTACGEQGEGISYHCPICCLRFHTSCCFLPVDLLGPSHPHRLSLKFRCPYPSQIFRCDICGADGSLWLYRCDVCEFDAHLKCAKPPLVEPQASASIRTPAGSGAHVAAVGMEASIGVPPTWQVITDGVVAMPQPPTIGSTMYLAAADNYRTRSAQTTNKGSAAYVGAGNLALNYPSSSNHPGYAAASSTAVLPTNNVYVGAAGNHAQTYPAYAVNAASSTIVQSLNNAPNHPTFIHHPGGYGGSSNTVVPANGSSIYVAAGNYPQLGNQPGYAASLTAVPPANNGPPIYVAGGNHAGTILSYGGQPGTGYPSSSATVVPNNGVAVANYVAVGNHDPNYPTYIGQPNYVMVGNQDPNYPNYTNVPPYNGNQQLSNGAKAKKILTTAARVVVKSVIGI